MREILFLFSFLIYLPLLAQEQVLEMTKSDSEKVRTFKQNKRVKIKTLEGEKYIGRFQIIDEKTIEIEGDIIKLNTISNIKSRSIMAGIAGTGLILYGSLIALVGGLEHAWADNPQVGNGLFVAGAVIISSGIFFNEFARNQRSDKWNYKIIEK
ncbi:hypothetical protein [Salinimicrobium xinjiangense]|uniref:hypothetical protein n=1 Tax=Salinimicrobium xinjiangense TaxID=438596 RepID=UPI0003FB0C6C|nr:hypothetical protein [Salinimicrobium xinjiangense]